MNRGEIPWIPLDSTRFPVIPLEFDPAVKGGKITSLTAGGKHERLLPFFESGYMLVSIALLERRL
jgi:hypothetical protein